jgi:hypothetical protein
MHLFLALLSLGCCHDVLFQHRGQADFRLTDNAFCPPVIACFTRLHATLDLKDSRCARIREAFQTTIRASLSIWLP